jgi:hypothetical protein
MWIKTRGLKIETQALITSAQEQAMNINQHQAKVLPAARLFEEACCNSKTTGIYGIVMNTT